MGQITAPLSIPDSAAVAVLFTPRAVSAESTVLVNRGSVSLGDKKLTLGLKASTPSRPTTRIEIAFEYPVVDTATATPVVVGKAIFKGYFVVPDSFTQLQRADLRAFVANALDNTLVKAYVTDLDPIWG